MATACESRTSIHGMGSDSAGSAVSCRVWANEPWATAIMLRMCRTGVSVAQWCARIRPTAQSCGRAQMTPCWGPYKLHSCLIGEIGNVSRTLKLFF